MPRKGENIYKRKDGRWEGRYIRDRVNGKAKYGYVFAHSYKEVKIKLTNAKALLASNTLRKIYTLHFHPFWCYQDGFFAFI